jgi:uncharacterized protein (DUF2062 family)
VKQTVSNRKSHWLFLNENNLTHNPGKKMQAKTQRAFYRRKIIEPLKGFLEQGLTSKELALSIAFGVTLGTIPVLGVTTVLCALAAILLKLNLPVIQFANYLVYPLQILLLAPFYYVGELFFNVKQRIDIDVLRSMLTENTYKETITMLFDSTIYAVFAWLLISPILLALIYAALKPVLVRINSRSSRLKFIRR